MWIARESSDRCSVKLDSRLGPAQSRADLVGQFHGATNQREGSLRGVNNAASEMWVAVDSHIPP